MPDAPNNSNAHALYSTLVCLLDSISEKGYWTDPQDNWEPILACVAVEVLMDAGLKCTHSWVIHRNTYLQLNIEASLRWLNSRIQPNGTFGTDFWEACRLAQLIEKHNLHGYFSNYSELQKHIIDCYEQDRILTGNSDWTGPGFLSAASDYFDRIGRSSEATKLANKLLTMQDSDGHWMGCIVRAGHPIVSPVWHTSQVVLTLARRDKVVHRDSIGRAVSWIKQNQDSSGKWPDIQQYVIYSTCYAILALQGVESPDTDAINRGIEYLKSSMRADGRFHDLGGTLMAAIALLAVTENTMPRDLCVMDHVLTRMARAQLAAAQAETQAAKQEADALRARNSEYESKFKNAEYGVTKKQLFFAGLVVSFIIPTMGAVASRALSTLWPNELPAIEKRKQDVPEQKSETVLPPSSPATTQGL